MDYLNLIGRNKGNSVFRKRKDTQDPQMYKGFSSFVENQNSSSHAILRQLDRNSQSHDGKNFYLPAITSPEVA